MTIFRFKLNMVVPAMPAQVCLKACVTLLCSQVAQDSAHTSC
jgi:hypothetical protein